MVDNRELEKMVFTLRQQVEQEVQAKHELLSRECEKFRSLYYKTRREVECTKTEQEHAISERDRQIQALKQAHEEELATFENKIQTMQQNMDQTSDLERLRICQREKTELELRLSAILSELDQVRAEKEKQRLDFEMQERTHKRQLADQLSAAQLLHSERDALKSKCDSLEEQSRVVQRKADEYSLENTRLKRELDKTISKMEETQHTFKYVS
ncbi:hypothetical protein EDD86DRAFT_120885 [Gorgonomyces haynaldii]|nr:hypothetical protein EDD86DRAFT_120885 [Gorgonomyces haynaldii]